MLGLDLNEGDKFSSQKHLFNTFLKVPMTKKESRMGFHKCNY